MSFESDNQKLVKVAKITEFENVEVKSVSLLAKKVGIFKDSKGGFFAIEMACKHHGADLTEGEFDGDTVTCLRHGWKYNYKTGQCLTSDTLPLRRHELKIEGDDILVSLTPVSSKP
jgi:nitrite reductase/ring-hydroxylating ferredoxin subunit